MSNRTALVATLLGAVTLALPARAGTLVVLNKAEATASLIDDGTREVVATLRVGVGPHEVAVSPNGRLAVASNYGQQQPGNTLTVIDVRRARVRRTIDLGRYRRPHGIAWLPDGRHVWVTAEDARAIVKVDVRSGRIVRRLATGQGVSHLLALTPDASRAFVANIGSGSVSVFDLERGRKLRDVPTGAGAEGIDVTPDGRTAWITNRAADTITVLDALRLEPIAELESPSFPIRAKATPNGRHVLVTNARSGDVSVFDAVGHELLRRVRPTAAELGLAGDMNDGGPWSGSSVPIGILVPGDGRLAYVAHARGDVVSVISTETWTVVGTLRAGRTPDGMAWSPLRARKRVRKRAS